ncbi:MAG: SH3 domain-containing protein [Pseudomonadota bacterium]
MTPASTAPEASLSDIQSALMADWNEIYRVQGADTPSGFDVPRFVSLKFGRVNARTGPSRNHSIAYQYQRRGLPLIVVAETEMWRKVRDVEGDEAWVRKPALSGERSAIFQIENVITTKPGPDAMVVARVEKGALVKLDDCDAPYHCRVRTATGFKGYAPKAILWGTQDMN